MMYLKETAYQAANGFTFDVAASRTSGVGPLSVQFDCVTNSTFAYDGQELFIEFMWDFGDNGTANGTGTDDEYNIGKGFEVTHVYKEAGTYTATCTAWYRNYGDSTQTYEKTWSTSITVSEASYGTTYYISSLGSDSNDGLSESTPFLTAEYAINNFFGR